MKKKASFFFAVGIIGVVIGPLFKWMPAKASGRQFASGISAEKLDEIEAEIAQELPEDYKILGPDLFHAVLGRLADSPLRNSDSYMTSGGRLTLSSGTPVTTSDVTSATTIYYTPFNGGQVSFYNSTIANWQLLTFAEVTVGVPATTNTPFDIFAYNNSGTVALTTVNWTNASTRATALTLQDGVYVESGTLTNRYLGTGETTGTNGTTEDSIQKRFLWNEYNRVPKKIRALSATDSWNYGTATWEAAINGTTTTGVTRVEFVLGQSIEPVTMETFVPNIGGSAVGSIGIGIDSTSASSALTYDGDQRFGTFWFARYVGLPAVGYHYGQWLEYGATGPITFLADSQSGGVQRQGGLIGEIWQ